MQCRTCGEFADKEGLSLLEPQDVSLLPQADGSYPDFVCHACIVEIQHWRNFISRFQTSQKLFQQVLATSDHDSSQQTASPLQLAECRVLVHKLLQCDSCSFYTNNKSQLESHTQTHLTTNTAEENKIRKNPVIKGMKFGNGKCTQCGVFFIYPEMLSWHSQFCHGRDAIVRVVKTSNGKPNYQCNLCKTVCTTVQRILAHLNIQHYFVNFPFLCNACGNRFISIPYLMKHKCKGSSMHDIISLGDGVKCKLCTKVLKTEVEMKEHVSTAHTIKHKTLYFKCLHCSESFVSVAQLKSHCYNIHPGQHIFHCNMCKLKFTSHKIYLQHKKEKHRTRDVFSCNDCNSTFLSLYNLLNHIETVHTQNLSFSCEFCGAQTSNKHNLKQHIHNSHTGTILHCAHCSYTTRGKYSLVLHIRNKHTAVERSLKCNFCDAKYKFKRNLRQHIRYQHTGPILHCKLCRYITRRKEHLVMHNASKHSLLKNTFSCKFCNSKFKTKQYLDTHIRNIHTGTIVQCEHCDYSSRRKSNLVSHYEVKHLKKTFSCNVCSAKFKCKPYLNNHIRRAHTHMNNCSLRALQF